MLPKAEGKFSLFKEILTSILRKIRLKALENYQGAGILGKATHLMIGL